MRSTTEPFASAPSCRRVRRWAGAVAGVAAALFALGLEAAPRLVPDDLLRAWDPVTLFLDEAAGPAGGGATSDRHPAVGVWPDHPGELRWLDERTLQFRPAEPWPLGGRVSVSVNGLTWALHPALDPPVTMHPAADAPAPAGLDTLRLEFTQPVEPSLLVERLRVGLRDVHGDENAMEWLARGLVQVKALPRADRSAPWALELRLPWPVPENTEVSLALRLGEASDAPVWTASRTTAPAFRVVALGCRDDRHPIPLAGAEYGPEATLACGGGERVVAVEFSAPVANAEPMMLANLLRVAPVPTNLRVEVADHMALVRGDFEPGRRYRVSLGETALNDRSGRPLTPVGSSAVHLRFPALVPFATWGAATGVLERFGAMHVPLAARGEGVADVRLHVIDPLDPALWPFADKPVDTDDRTLPPGPGELAATPRVPAAWGDAEVLAPRIRSLGSPDWSGLVPLPTGPMRRGARFGLDLAPILEALGRDERPGTYLVGLRRPAADTARQWIRVQVTDLALTTVQRAGELFLAVTSLATGEPVPGARVQVQGEASDRLSLVDYIDGLTDEAGTLRWAAPTASGGEVRRIVVSLGEDRLVIDPVADRERFARGAWQADDERWLQWTRAGRDALRERATLHCHVFSERPVYRPDEPVLLKAWLRTRAAGQFSPVLGEATLIVDGPADAEWRLPVTLGALGTFDRRLDDLALEAGEYQVRVDLPNGESCGQMGFRKEAYKLPEVELRLHGDTRVALDGPFEVSATAHFYAGGRAADRPVRWRVTQFPYQWRPTGEDGFAWSTVTRYGVQRPLAGESVLDTEARTDASGSAVIRIDPGAEPSALARRYIIEATVTGTDGRTVTATREVLGLPAFAPGLRLPAVLADDTTVRAEVMSLSPDGVPEAGRALTVRLLQREWHAHLRAGDFSSGVARYVTEAVDRELGEIELLTRADGPATVDFPLEGAGVYVVVVSGRDALGRVVSVQRDVFVSGEAPVTWARPPSKVLTVTPDAARYAPGDTATLVVQSPYQSARVLAVIEAPEGNEYRWLDVEGGAATLTLAVAEHHAPNLPVHFALFRGRSGERPGAGALDAGKPATLAGSVDLAVEPAANRVAVTVDSPARVRPGESMELVVKLADEAGAPLAGEVTLWLVDHAVLALGREQRVDPLPTFVRRRETAVSLRDTRNELFGFLPLTEYPGGGAGDLEPRDLLDNVTVRRRFVPVAFYAPALQVDESGTARVRVEMPDNLTRFALRAKAVSGNGRFGSTTGTVAVRLPMIAQPRLPRFVRPGDRFDAGAEIRALEPEDGEGLVSLLLDGLESDVAGDRPLGLSSREPTTLRWPVTVPGDGAGQVAITVRAARASDGAGDGFEVTLPVHADRRPVFDRRRLTLDPGESLVLEGLAEAPRPGSLERAVRVAADPTITSLLGAVSALSAYPYACTEQRIAQSTAGLALARFNETLGVPGDDEQLRNGLREAMAWIEDALDERELVAYWPGGRGYVALTAWSLQLVVSVREAGHDVPEALESRLVRSLRRALRSDYPALLDGSEFAERAWALAALADAGHADPGYPVELALSAQFFALENLAQVVRVLASEGGEARLQADELGELLWSGLRTGLRDGREQVTGVAGGTPIGGVLLPSEVRTLAELLRTAVVLDDDARRRLLAEAIVARADGDGWGSTNANAAALSALADTVSLAGPDEPVAVAVRAGGEDAPITVLRLHANRALEQLDVAGSGPLRLTHASRSAGPVSVLEAIRYRPLATGDEAPGHARGLVVRREWHGITGAMAGERLALEAPGQRLTLAAGDVIEGVLELVNPQDRHHVALVAPLAAGLEPLNPALEGAPPEASASIPDGASPTYRALLDHEVRWFFDSLPAGTYRFAWRARAVTPGDFVQPPAHAELMYDQAVSGASPGARVRVSAP